MKDKILIREQCRNVILVVCDLDGTLLKDDKTLSLHTLEALRRARERGIFVTFCTARVPEMAQTYVKLAEVEGPFIACAGALIWDTVRKRNMYAGYTEPEETRARGSARKAGGRNGLLNIMPQPGRKAFRRFLSVIFLPPAIRKQKAGIYIKWRLIT